MAPEAEAAEPQPWPEVELEATAELEPQATEPEPGSAAALEPMAMEAPTWAMALAEMAEAAPMPAHPASARRWKQADRGPWPGHGHFADIRARCQIAPDSALSQGQHHN